jgi:hypothetical protein
VPTRFGSATRSDDEGAAHAVALACRLSGLVHLTLDVSHLTNATASISAALAADRSMSGVSGALCVSPKLKADASSN